MKKGVFVQKKHLEWFAYALTVSFCSLCLPWFSFDPQMTGYQWGIVQGIPAVVAGIAALQLCRTLSPGRAAWGAIILLLLFMPMWDVFRFFTWHYMTITGKISLRLSLEAAQPGFYISLGLSPVPLIVFLLCKKKEA